MPFRPAMPFVIRPRVYTNAARSYFSAVQAAGSKVTDDRKQLYDNLILRLSNAGHWNKLDRLFVLAAEDATAALIDLVARSTATLTNAPAFATDRGYTTNGTDNWIDTIFDPATAPSPKFVQDSATWSLWTRTAGQTSLSGNGIFVAGSGVIINPRNVLDQASIRMNQTASIAGGTVTDGSGLFTGSRTGAAVVNIYRNGVSLFSDVTTSEPVADATFHVGHTNTAASFAAREWAVVAIGSGRSATEELNFYNILQTYMTAVGA